MPIIQTFVMSSSASSAASSPSGSPTMISVKPDMMAAAANVASASGLGDHDAVMSDFVSQPAPYESATRTPARWKGKQIMTRDLGLNSPGMDMSGRKMNVDGMALEVDYASDLLDKTWSIQHLPDPFNPPEVSPLQSVSLPMEKEQHYFEVLTAAQARAAELDKNRPLRK